MFLLVPAHPGCPGQIPQSRKTVVCVCVLPVAVARSSSDGDAICYVFPVLWMAVALLFTYFFFVLFVLYILSCILFCHLFNCRLVENSMMIECM